MLDLRLSFIRTTWNRNFVAYVVHQFTIVYNTNCNTQKRNKHTYLSSRHIGLSWTICRLTFGPTRSRMLFSPYLIIVGLQGNWKCIRFGSRHFSNKCHKDLSPSTSVINVWTMVHWKLWHNKWIYNQSWLQIIRWKLNLYFSDMVSCCFILDWINLF